MNQILRLAAALLPLALAAYTNAQSVTTPPTLNGAVVVHLAPNIDATRRLGWSPKGAIVPLKQVGATLQGHFTLGPPGLPPINVELRHSDPAGEVDALAIDLNRNGSFEDAELLACQPNENRGKFWSSFSTTVPIPVLDPWGQLAEVPYPMNLWYVRDPLEPDAPPTLRWSRSGFYIGTCKLDGADAVIMICEREIDRPPALFARKRRVTPENRRLGGPCRCRVVRVPVDKLRPVQYPDGHGDKPAGCD